MAAAFQGDAYQSDSFEGNAGAQSIVLGLISQTASPFSPTVTAGAVTVALGLIDQAAAPFTPTVVDSGVTLAFGLIDQTASSFAPTLTTGAVDVSLALIDRTAVAYAPGIATLQSVLLDLIDQTAVPLTPTIGGGFSLGLLSQAAVAFAPTTTSLATISLALTDRTAATFAPTTTARATISLGLLTQTATTFTPTLVYNQFVGSLSRINRTAVLHEPTLIWDPIVDLPRIDQLTGVFSPYIFPPNAPPYLEAVVGGTNGLGGSNIWDNVIIADATFTSQVNGTPGSCRFRVRDDDNTMNFVIGDDIVLTLNGENLWRGFIAHVSRGYAFSAEDRSVPKARIFTIEGWDINILFRKRVVFKRSNPKNMEGPLYSTNNTSDLVALRELLDHYLYLDDDNLNTTSAVEAVGVINVNQPVQPLRPSGTWEDSMRSITSLTNAIFYIDPDRRVVHTDVDTPNAPFALSDKPVGAEVGYRQMEVLTDGTNLINDAFIWGVGMGGGPVPIIAHEEDATSITTHGRWQYAELNTSIYKQLSANRRAASIVDGSPASKRGAKNDKVSVTCTIFEPGVRVADKVDFTSEVFGFTDVIPVRRMDITFINPTTPRYKLYLSHEIDLPWTFFDNYYYNYQRPSPTRIVLPPFGCTDGSVLVDEETFTRVVTGGSWGTSEFDGTPAWTQVGGGTTAGAVDGDNAEMVSTGFPNSSTIQRIVNLNMRFPIEVLVRMRVVPTLNASVEIQFTFFDASGNYAGFDFISHVSSGILQRAAMFAGTSTETLADSTTGQGSIQPVTWYYLRVSIASMLKLRYWKDTDPEPAYWHLANHIGETVLANLDLTNTMQVTIGGQNIQNGNGGEIDFIRFYEVCDGPATGPQQTDHIGDNSQTVFLTSGPYVAGSTRVYVSGFFFRQGIDYTESDPDAGEITFGAAPTGGSYIAILYEGIIL